jgi:hypothetical protein
MSYEDWLRRKADQYGHSEILAFLMIILGMNLLVGGFIVTVITTGQIMDLQFIIQHSLSQSSAIGLILTARALALNGLTA